MSLRRASLLCCVAATLAVSGPGVRAEAPAPLPAREAAWRENNLGVALLEQFRFADAVGAFGRALEKDPSLLAARINLAIAQLYVPDIPAAKQSAEEALKAAPLAPQPNYLLALIARSEGRAEDAVPYVRRVLEKDPKDLGANVTLGQVYLQTRQFEEAAAAFRLALASEPYNVSAAYNLGVALTRAGKREEGQEAMAAFQKLRDSAYKSALGSNYLEQGKYAEALASTGAEPEAVDAKTPAVSLAEKGEAAPGASTLVLADLDADGALDVVSAGRAGLRVLRNEQGRLTDVTEKTGLAGVDARVAVAGDYDNDGLPDLLASGPAGVSLLHNEGGGRFKAETAGVPAWPNAAATAAFVDIDHDGDLDVFVAAAAPQGPGLLLRNNGDRTFADITDTAQLGGAGGAVAVVPTDFDNRRDVDLFVLKRDRPVLFKNMRDGSFKDLAAELGLVATGPFASAAAGDVNKDGYTDFFLGGQGPSSLALSDGRGAFQVVPAPPAAAGALAAQLFDYDNDGLLDLLVVTAKGPRLLRGLGASWADVSAAAFTATPRKGTIEAAALAVADLDADGDEDALLATPSDLRRLVNEGGNRNHSFAVQLAGRVSSRGGVGAKVEIRAGSLRQKIETSAAVPMAAPADVVFGLGARTAPDAVRIIWVSGIVQTETEMGASAEPGRRASLPVNELDRKPSSCPYLYAWNGERFEFLTDFLGAGEMGYYEAPGVRNEPDPVELVRIAPGRLAARNGRYELRVTNELEEVLYLDRLRLVALDHPADVLVYPDEGMTSPPKPFRLFAVRDPRTPRATDHSGRDVTARLAATDRAFVDGLPLERVRGYAKEHALTLDLSSLPPSHTVLLLTGWTDYAFSSDNVAAHQMGLAAAPPRLEVERADGRWATAVEQVGIPVGRPQTVVVDLGGKLGPSRRVRVVTTMRVYWDEAAVAAPAPDVALAPAALDPVRADLGERGFSAVATEGEPLGFDYSRVSWRSPWKTMPGRYTREGDVRPLLAAADDAFVVSKPGDELALSFDASALPAVGAGRARTFLLDSRGYSKEMDINSASPDIVLPLPYEGMKAYPYAEADVPPAVRKAAQQAEAWNTRLVVRPIVPIELYAAARHPEGAVETSPEGSAVRGARNDSGAMTGHIRYSAACCQTDLPNPLGRAEMRANTDRMLSMVDSALAGSAPFLPVRLVVFPEFAHAAPVHATVAELLEKLAVPVPNEHTDRLCAKAKEHGVFIQSGTMIEADPRWPGFLFNTTCLIGPGGILYKYRKVNPWIPFEVHASPHDVPGYDEPLFPVADTEIGRIGCAICYDWVFPEAIRQLAVNGAEVLVRVSAYMDPWGATEPMDWWTVVNRCRALENVAYVVAANQGAQLRRYPPYSWPGGSMVVDFDGRVLAQASPGPGERIVVAPVDVSALRHERRARRGHHMLAHLRTEAYPVYRGHVYPPAGAKGPLSYEENNARIDAAKKSLA